MVQTFINRVLRILIYKLIETYAAKTVKKLNIKSNLQRYNYAILY